MSEEMAKPKLADSSEQKIQLECEKLRAEIHAIRHPVYKTPGFYAATAPVAIAIIGLLFTWSSGWFDVQRTRISNEKTLLEAENSRLTDEKARLTDETMRLETAKAAINERKTQDQQSLSLLTNELAQFQRQKDEKEQIISALNAQITNLTAQSEGALPLVKQISQLQAERDKAASELLEARAHLASAHEHARILVVDAQSVFNAIKVVPNENFAAYRNADSEWTFDVGKWRAGYESDSAQFDLIDFVVNTNAAPKPK